MVEVTTSLLMDSKTLMTLEQMTERQRERERDKEVLIKPANKAAN